MSLKKRIGLGVTLEVATDGNQGSLAFLTAIVDTIDGPNSKADIVTTPLLSEAFHDKVKGQIDGGDVTFTIAYDPDDDTTITLKALLRQTTPCPLWRIKYPGATNTDAFSAHMSHLGVTRKIGAYIVGNVTLAVVGDPG